MYAYFFVIVILITFLVCGKVLYAGLYLKWRYPGKLLKKFFKRGCYIIVCTPNIKVVARVVKRRS